MRASLRAHATAAFRKAVSDDPVVHVRLDGMPALASFAPDPAEHERRQLLEAGAVTSTGLLHGLWELPEGVAVEASSVPDNKLDLLVRAPHVATVSGSSITRTYIPAGQIHSVAFVGSELRGAVRRAVRYAPIFHRWAVVPAAAARSSALRAEACEWNIGVVAFDDESSQVVVPAGPPVRGIPGVYRWWVVETAYRSWLYDRAQAANCALAASGP